MEDGGGDDGFVLWQQFFLGKWQVVGCRSFSLYPSPFLASSSSSFSKIGVGVVPVNFARAFLMPLISACVSLYLASTITLTNSIYVLC
ncbi:hypothetical protein Hanom_Chr12g01119121 [Helianthus anomalus]